MLVREIDRKSGKLELFGAIVARGTTVKVNAAAENAVG
jgi:hypothetical protein